MNQYLVYQNGKVIDRVMAENAENAFLNVSKSLSKETVLLIMVVNEINENDWYCDDSNRSNNSNEDWSEAG